MSLLDPPALFDAPPVVHRAWAELEAQLDHFRGSPKEEGTLELLVARPSAPAAGARRPRGGGRQPLPR